MGEVDLEMLLKLRLLVARHGEMDCARWWNTQGLLGRHGAVVLRRGFPRTHLFAQARVVFSVAQARCQEVFDAPDSMTLWNLPAELEDQFDTEWQTWLDQVEDWEPYFDRLAALNGQDLIDSLQNFELITSDQIEEVRKLRRSAEGKAVLVSGGCRPNAETLTLLAGAFSRGESGSLAVPYAKLAEES